MAGVEADVKLTQAPPEALRKSRFSCSYGLVQVQIGRYVGDASGKATSVQIEVFEDIADRVRLAARHGAKGFLFMPDASAVDPFGPEAHIQSATFLAMAAALETGASVRFLTEGIPARGFSPLFRRYPDNIAGQIRFLGPAGSALDALEPRAASVDARLRGVSRLILDGEMSRRVAARIDPLIPGLNDDPEFLEPLARSLREAGVKGAVIAPLRFSADWRERIRKEFGDKVLARISRYYIPGRASKKVAPIPPGERLPLERETSIAWRLKLAFEAHPTSIGVCTCKDTKKGSCGLGASIGEKSIHLKSDEQPALWAV